MYFEVSLLAADPDFSARTTAAYTTETLGTTREELPSQWTQEHAWDMAAQPGFGDAYASALAGGVPTPGRDPAVISDGQILSAVQLLLAAAP